MHFSSEILLYLLFILLAAAMIALIILINRLHSLQKELEQLRADAFTDKLTGLKNHRAYFERVEYISGHAEQYENAQLIYISLSNLKDINEQYGYQAGDELVISTAGCMERAFGKENSFRIKNNEFCAILENPDPYDRSAYGRWKREVADYNKWNAGQIQTHFGCSMLRDPDGTVKSASQWKQDADRDLSEDRDSRIERIF